MSNCRLRRLSAASLLLVVVACGAPESSPIASPSASQSAGPPASVPASVQPSPAIATPSVTPPAAPTATAAGELEWRLIGQMDGRAAGLTSFSGGYLSHDDGELAGIWFSPDGIDWQLSQVGTTIVPCPGWTPRPDAHANQILAAGSRVVLLGDEYDPDNWQCGDDGREAWRPVGWTSADGRQWQRAPLSMTPRTSHISAVWLTTDGWEAAVTENDDTPAPGETVVLSSADGLTWHETARLGNRIAPYDETGPLVAAAADGAGRRLMAMSEWVEDDAAADDEARVISLFESSDGVTWHALDTPFGGRHLSRYEELPYVTHVVAPTDTGGRWLVVVQTEGGSPARVWATRDFATWENAEFPRPTVDFIEPTSLGLLAQGRVECYQAGGACPNPRQRQFVSRDGLDWAPLQPRLTGDLSVVDGPAGVLLIGHDSGRVWRLVP
jgi:hypothetical protein